YIGWHRCTAGTSTGAENCYRARRRDNHYSIINGRRRAHAAWPTQSRDLMTISRLRRLFASGALVGLYWASSGRNTSPQAKEANALRRGEALRDKKDYTRALIEFKNAAAAMPKDAEPYYQMGITFLASGSMGNGVAYLRKATELNPNHQKA